MGKKRDIHVTPHRDGGWQTKREGASRAGSRHESQGDAAERGRKQAKREHVELVIHRRDGTIRDSDSYGRDPHPPEDKKH
jgi:hypothetical protein